MNKIILDKVAEVRIQARQHMERIISINPKRRKEYQEIIEQKFRDWHHEEWELAFPSYEYFRENIANASFLAYLSFFLEVMGDNGQVEIDCFESLLRAKLGEYFSDHKFENAVRFFEDSDWENL